MMVMSHLIQLRGRGQSIKYLRKGNYLFIMWLIMFIDTFIYRASKLHNELKNVEFEKLKNGREWPQVRAGDAIEVKVCFLK